MIFPSGIDWLYQCLPSNQAAALALGAVNTPPDNSLTRGLVSPVRMLVKA